MEANVSLVILETILNTSICHTFNFCSCLSRSYFLAISNVKFYGKLWFMSVAQAVNCLGEFVGCLAKVKHVIFFVSFDNLFQTDRPISYVIMSKISAVFWVFWDHAFLFDSCVREELPLFVLTK